MFFFLIKKLSLSKNDYFFVDEFFSTLTDYKKCDADLQLLRDELKVKGAMPSHTPGTPHIIFQLNVDILKLFLHGVDYPMVKHS